MAENDSLLYAGIPWFNEGWGRDTFISLPGLLVTGHADAARKLIIRFANWIDRSPNSVTYGRIPNRVRPGEEIAYNTADGTSWWIRSIYMYGIYTRDYSLWDELLFQKRSEEKPWAGAARIALSGAILNCDSLGFLKHADQETWMDAVGTTGCVTPRGNRAVEIQALNYAALDAAVKMAFFYPDNAFKLDVNRWDDARKKIEHNFLKYYLKPSRDGLWDHLNTDGTPDSLRRPNELFAITVPLTPLVPDSLRVRMIQKLTADLVEEYGVMSLSPKEALFHPFHMDEHYPKDDAYHNGVIWTWLSGPAKDALRMEGRMDLALKIANYEAWYMLNRGMVGSLPELFDAMPRKGEKIPHQSGCTSQAWSLAEFLRTGVQDVLGIRPVFMPNKVEPFWLFDPRIPQEWGETKARVVLEGTPIMVTMQNFGDSLSVTLDCESEPKEPIGIKVFDERNGITGYLNLKGKTHFIYHHHEGIGYTDGIPTAPKLKLTGWPWDGGNKTIALAKPLKMQKWPSLAPKPWKVLTAKEALAKNKKAKVIVDADDPIGDDEGENGKYVYPLDEHFAPGILDLTHFTVKEDKKKYYFSLQFANLVDPGWHPEYGFQLTYVAIVISDDIKSKAEGDRASPVIHVRAPADVGANSKRSISKGWSAAIYVGGGFRVEDAKANTLAEFTPRDRVEALGDVTTKRISFSIPKKYLPLKKDGQAWTVLIGAQDDHGGAGMGEFRAVKAQVEQWAGGGNDNDGPNIYDTLYVKTQP